MEWKRTDPQRRRAWTHGRIVKCTPIYVSDAGYQVAFADLLDTSSGWALWRRTRGGFRRLVSTMHFASAEEAMAVAELEIRRSSFGAGLPLRLAAVGLLLTKRAVGGERIDAMITAADRSQVPSQVKIIARYINALTKEVSRGQAN